MNKDYLEVSRGLEDLRLEDSYLAIIVEGKHDKEALGKLGFKNIFTYVKNAESTANIIRDGGFLEVAILTDFDTEGIRKEAELKGQLLSMGIRINDYFRRHFRKVFRVNTVEETIYYSRNNLLGIA